MLKIGICDDEQLIADKLKKIMIKCLKEMHLNAEVSVFLCGRDLLKEAGRLHAVFLDVLMPDLDGYETAVQLKCLNPDCLIIMETVETDHFEKAFEIGAIRYIRKPFDRLKIKEALAEIGTQAGMLKTIAMFKRRKKYEIKQRDIKYAMAYNGYTEFCVGNEVFRREESLCNIEKELDSGYFVRVHKRYLVNLHHVSRGQDGGLFIDGKPIPVSRRRKAAFDKAFIDYFARKA